MRYLLYVVVVVAAVGCGKNRPEEGSWSPGAWPARIVSVDNFSDKERAAVLSAVEALNQGTGTTLVHPSDVGSGYPIYIQLVEVEPTKQNRAGLAVVEDEKCTISISRLVFSIEHRDKLVPVVEHEIGHCAGLDHVSQQGEVMFSSSDPISRYKPDAFGRFFQRIRQSVGL